MPLPATLNLDIYQGDSFALPLRITVGSGDDPPPMDLTGCTLRAQIRRRAAEADVLAEFVATITDAAAGEATLSLGPEKTANLPTACVWDLELEDSLGAIRTILAGEVNVPREVTRADA